MFNPMKLKDYVTLGNVLGGLASMVAAVEGSLDWACYFMLIAWVFDSIDGAVARITGGGNKFGEVLDNTADLVAYSLAPTFMIFVLYRTPRELGGAGWPLWAAVLLASIPTLFGCIRFARNNVKEIILPEFHLGLPRTVYALTIATLFTSHLFQGARMQDSASVYNPVLFALAAVFVVVISMQVLTLRPFYAKPKRGASGFVVFSTVWFLTTTLSGFVVGLFIGSLRIFLDVLLVNFNLYLWFHPLAIPRHKKREIRAYTQRLVAEWKQEMG